MTNNNKPLESETFKTKEQTEEFTNKLTYLLYEITVHAGNTGELHLGKVKEIEDLLAQAHQSGIEQGSKVTGETSDGYHTFNELYEFRKLYNSVLFNEWAKQGKYKVHKSKKHHDGEDCFGGRWFIVSATTPFGQISNHYELKDWDLFNCEERDRAIEWDGHTAQDVIKRLEALSTSNKE